MKLNIPINSNNVYKGILAILNFSTQLTETELDVIATMMQSKTTYLTKDVRARLSSLLGVSKYSFNNHVKRLKDKKVLVSTDEYIIEINPSLVKTVERCIADGMIVLEFVE